MRRSILAGSLCLLLTLGITGCSDDEAERATFTAALSGANEVPPNMSAATGTATLEFDGSSTVQFRVEARSITNVSAAHIHSGAEGANGPIRVTLFNGPTTGAVDGQLAQGSFGESDVQGISFDALLDELRNGSAYVNVHTTELPDGEIRGQVRRQ